MISEAGTNAGEDKLKRKMVASGPVLPVGSTHTQRIKKIYRILNGEKYKKLIIVVNGDLQLEIVTGGICRQQCSLKMSLRSSRRL